MRDSKISEQFNHVARRDRSILKLLDRHGLAKGKTATLSGRVNPRLLTLVRENSGAASDSQLIELALGNLIFDNGFPEAFRKVRGTVDPDVDLDL